MINRKKLKLSETVTVIGAVVYFVGFLTHLDIISMIGIAVFAVGLILFVRICRCPHCGKPIRGGLSSSPSDDVFCRHCGKKIELED